MKLDQTVNLMLSNKYEDRLLAEYQQLTYRTSQLQKYIQEVTLGNAEPKCSKDLLNWQLKTMQMYLYVLRARMDDEEIEYR